MPLVVILIGLEGGAAFNQQCDATHSFNFKAFCEQGKEIRCSLPGLMWTLDMSDNTCWSEWKSSGYISVQEQVWQKRLDQAQMLSEIARDLRYAAIQTRAGDYS